jgi:hypothetical protein
MHPHLDAIVAADAAAQREVDAAARRIAERDAAERVRVRERREAALGEARARLEADVRAIESAAHDRVAARRAAREARGARRRARADAAAAAAVSAYVRIVRGDPSPGAGP